MESLTRKSLKHKSIKVLCCVLLCIISISCQEQGIYYDFHQIKEAEWAQNDTLIFEIDSASFEINKPYSLSIEVTNNVNYPYRNIWFFSQTNIENDSVFTEVSTEYQLADIEGKWLGSGFGTLYQSSLPLTDNIVFREKRNYCIKLEHGMRDEILPGIEKVGIKLSIKE